LETIDVTLDEMEPGSDFLGGLWGNDDPQLPYSVVVGNTSLIPADPQSPLREKLHRKLTKGAEFPFMGKPNDIAVTVESIKGVPTWRSPQPICQEVACNHLVYFVDPAGLTGLSEAIARAFQGDPPAPGAEELSPTQPNVVVQESQPQPLLDDRAEPLGTPMPSRQGDRLPESGWWKGAMVLGAIAVVGLGVVVWQKLDHQQPEPQSIVKGLGN
jgi:hypothetical protein